MEKKINNNRENQENEKEGDHLRCKPKNLDGEPDGEEDNLEESLHAFEFPRIRFLLFTHSPQVRSSSNFDSKKRREGFKLFVSVSVLPISEGDEFLIST